MHSVHTKLSPAAALVLLALCMACSTSPDVRQQRTLLQEYARAIKADRPDEAYKLLSAKQRRTLSLDAFKRRWKSVRPELRERARELAEPRSAAHLVQARVVSPTGLDFQLTREDGRWRISKGFPETTRTATPEEALRAFILAVEQEDFQGAIQLLSREARLKLQGELADRVKNIRSALKDGIEVDSGRAVLRYGRYRRVRLVKERGQWRIQDLQ